jgi:hypothetical protein
MIHLTQNQGSLSFWEPASCEADVPLGAVRSDTLGVYRDQDDAQTQHPAPSLRIYCALTSCSGLAKAPATAESHEARVGETRPARGTTCQ